MNDLIANISATLSSPMVLCFLLGLIATLLKSDLKFPPEIYTALTIYLLLGIGIKGGIKISDANLHEVIKPAAFAILLGITTPAWCYFILKKIGKFDVTNAAAIAAHYGSVSAVTFGEALAFLDNQKIFHEGFLPALLAIMEIPAIIVAILIAKIVLRNTDEGSCSWKELFHDLLTGKSTFLLVGGLTIGIISSHHGYDQVAPFFDTPFRGVLSLFLLEVGLVAGRRLQDLVKAGPFLLIFGICMPLLHAIIGIHCGYWAGLSYGGAMILGVLAASASYIAAPAAVRMSLPAANPSYYLTASLAITFPFNVTIGLPIYFTYAKRLYGV